MKPRTYYTTTEVRWLLGKKGRMLDTKVLTRWMAEAEIVSQPGPHDGRERRITRTQLEALARKHGILLPADDTLLEKVEQPPSLQLVATRMALLVQLVEGLQEDMGILKQQNELLRLEVTRLRQQLSPSVLDEKGKESVTPPTHPPPVSALAQNV